MSDSKSLVPANPELMKSPSVFKRLTQAVTYALRGGFFSPEAPIQATHPETTGRRFDYPAGFNLWIKPRRDSGITFEALRGFAQAYDLLRVIIETRKDQVCAFEWSISPKNQKGNKTPDEKSKTVCDQIQAFFENPASNMDWNAWLRCLLEDVFIVDAVPLWPTYLGKKLSALEIIDPATIKIVIDDSGRIAEPPYPAYQQVLKGIVANEFRKDELFYFIRNQRSNTVYGYSHVEQIMMTVNIGLRREMTQLAYFTEGNIPEAIAGVPETWTAEQIVQFQTYWDSMLKGNIERRVGNLKFVPNDASKIAFLRNEEATLKGEFDEWLARIICYTFSVSPIPFIKQTNRSVSESMQETAKEEGLLPLLHHIRRIMNTVIEKGMGIQGFEFKWNLHEDVDPKTQNEIDMAELEHGIVSIDDLRMKKGEEPLGIGPMIWVNGAPIPIDMIKSGTAPHLLPPPAPSPGFGGDDEEGGPPKKAPPKGQEASKRIAGPFRKGIGYDPAHSGSGGAPRLAYKRED